MSYLEQLEAMVMQLADELEEEFGKGGPELESKRPWSLIRAARELVEKNKKW
jgi:hypothetical protein